MFMGAYSVGTLVVCLLAAIEGGFKKTMEQTAFYIVIGIITSAQQVYLLCYQDQVKKMVDILKGYQEQHVGKWQTEMFERDSLGVWKVIRYYNMVMGSYNVFYFSLPFVVDLVGGLINPNFPVVRFPLPSQQYVEDYEPRSWGNVLYSLIGITTGILTIEMNIGIEALIYISIIYTKTELNMIKKKLSIIKEVMERKGDNYRMDVVRLMKDVTRHHQSTLEGLDMMDNILGFPIAVQNTIYSICFCIDLYVLTIFDSEVKPGPFIVSIFSLTMMAIILFLFCYIGESLENTNNEVFEALYDVPWYQEGPQIRKHLTMMIQQANKPFVINYHGMSNLNLHNFMQVINTSYSYFMMLKSTM
nr:odorant receptor 4-like [Halyomorpha halys]